MKPIEKVREEAAKHAKRIVALGWANAKSENAIAGAWEAGYVFGSLDKGNESQSESTPSISDGVKMIAEERERQVEKEGWSADHDDEHCYGEMAMAAAYYATYGTDARITSPDNPDCGWPWDEQWKKPGAHLRNLVKAGALVAAEIDREIRRINKINV